MIDTWIWTLAYATNFINKHGRDALSYDENPRFVVLANGTRAAVGVDPLGTVKHYWYRDGSTVIPAEVIVRMAKFTGLDADDAIRLLSTWIVERPYLRFYQAYGKDMHAASQAFTWLPRGLLDDADLATLAEAPRHAPVDPVLCERLATQYIKAAPKLINESCRLIPIPFPLGGKENVAHLAFEAFVEVYGTSVKIDDRDVAVETPSHLIGLLLEALAKRPGTFSTQPKRWQEYFRRPAARSGSGRKTGRSRKSSVDGGVPASPSPIAPPGPAAPGTKDHHHLDQPCPTCSQADGVVIDRTANAISIRIAAGSVNVDLLRAAIKAAVSLGDESFASPSATT